MNLHRTVSVALALAAAVMLTTSTLGVTSVSADRDVSVPVVDDDNAMIGYASGDSTVEDGGLVDLVTVENRLPGDVVVTNVSVDAGEFTVTSVDEPTVSSGESETIRGNVDCTPGASETVEATVSLDGNSVSASIYGDSETREFELECAAAGSLDNANFTGNQKFSVDATGETTRSITYWTEKKSGGFTQHSTTFDTTEVLKQKDLVAVYFEDADVTFARPGFDEETQTVDNWGTGAAQRFEYELELGDD